MIRNGPLTSEEPLHVNLEISPGDKVFDEALWRVNKESMYMYVRDRTSGRYLSVEIPEKESRVYHRTQLEFAAAERPVPGELQNFGSFNLIGNEGLVSGSGWASLANLGHVINDRMQARDKEGNPTGQVMASNSGLFEVAGGRGAGFTTTWQHCHP